LGRGLHPSGEDGVASVADAYGLGGRGEGQLAFAAPVAEDAAAVAAVVLKRTRKNLLTLKIKMKSFLNIFFLKSKKVSKKPKN
jgi:hypothetical protein